MEEKRTENNDNNTNTNNNKIIINLIKSGEGKGEGRGGEGASLSGSLASHHSALTERLTSRVLYTFVGRKYSPVRFSANAHRI